MGGVVGGKWCKSIREVIQCVLTGVNNGIKTEK